MNWPTIIVLAFVAAVFIAIIINAVKNKRAGKPTCSCAAGCDGSCEGCSACSQTIEDPALKNIVIKRAEPAKAN